MVKKRQKEIFIVLGDAPNCSYGDTYFESQEEAEQFARGIAQAYIGNSFSVVKHCAIVIAKKTADHEIKCITQYPV